MTQCPFLVRGISAAGIAFLLLCLSCGTDARLPVAASSAPAPASTGWLRLRVLDTLSDEPAAGRSLWLTAKPGAKASAVAEPAAFEIQLRTDAEGRASVEVPASTEIVLRTEAASSELAQHRIRPLQPAETREQDILLQPRRGREVSARVADRNGVAIRGAQISVLVLGFDDPYAYDPEVRDGELRAFEVALRTSEEEGRFPLRLSSALEQVLRVEAEGFVTRTVAIPAALPGDALVVEMTSGATLEARIRNASGLALSGIRVALQAALPALRAGAELSESKETRWSATTDDEGRVRIAGLPAVPLQISWFRQETLLRGHREGLLLQVGETSTLEWTFGQGARVQGHLVDEDGVPIGARRLSLFAVPSTHVPDAELTPAYLDDPSFSRAAAATAWTAEDGSYLFEDVLVGRWWLGPTPLPDAVDRRRDIAAYALPVCVDSGVRELELTLTAYRGRFLKGRVVDPDGGALPSGLVEFHPEGVFASYAVPADQEGGFEFGPLAPGVVLLRAQDRLGILAASEVLRAEAPQSGIELQTVPGGKLTGLVLDAESLTPVPAWVRIGSDRPGGEEFLTTPEQIPGHQPRGKIERSGLPVGRYYAIAMSEDGRAGFVTNIDIAAEHVADIEVHLEPAGRLLVLAATPTSPIYVEVRSGLDVVHLEYTRGESSLLLPAGSYQVSIAASPSAALATHPVKVVAGEEARLTLAGQLP